MFSVERGLLTRDEFLYQLVKIVGESKIVTNNRKISYYNLPAGFDIEVTSFYEGEIKRSVMYHWQFGIFNIVTTGRTWEEYVDFIESVKIIMGLNNELRLLVYVHNLPYEFQFIRRRFNWEKVFLLDERKPVYANNFGIEYRCSLKLAGGKSLENVGKDLQKYPVNKAVGDLDYSIIRTPLTPLTKTELYYCEMDIRVILSYIQEKIEQDGDITRIPLTNTGYVRNYCRKECFKKRRDYWALMSELTVTPDEYSQLKRAFQGGFTHASSHHARDTLSNVRSQDFTSSYPAVMVLEQFPMSKAKLIENDISKEQLEKLLLTKCCLFEIEIFDIRPKLNFEHPISASKCYILEGAVEDNGRVVVASRLKTTITEQDYFIYNEFYKWDKCVISNFRYYDKAYLPKRFVLAILELYRKKTLLKGNPSEVVNYMISKNMLNACFGMAVTNIIRDLYEYEEDTKLENGDITDFPKQEVDVEERIEKYNTGKNRFLFYPWGVWITAYARANLFSGIIELGDDYCYSDTDSLKYLNHEKHKDYFDRYNANIRQKIKWSSDHHKIPIEMYAPVVKNIPREIGVWDDEGEYRLFKTLGAKRYLTMKWNKKQEDFITIEEDGMEIKIQNNVFVLTMAGAHKKKAMEYLIKTGNPFEEFSNGLVIPKDSSGRLILTYIDHKTDGVLVDCNGVPFEYHELSSVHMENSEYRLGMDKYEKYLDRYELIEEFIQYVFEKRRDFSE